MQQRAAWKYRMAKESAPKVKAKIKCCNENFRRFRRLKGIEYPREIGTSGKENPRRNRCKNHRIKWIRGVYFLNEVWTFSARKSPPPPPSAEKEPGRFSNSKSSQISENVAASLRFNNLPFNNFHVGVFHSSKKLRALQKKRVRFICDPGVGGVTVAVCNFTCSQRLLRMK